MHHKSPPKRALPHRFRKPRLLLVGCGDVAARVANQLHHRYRIIALLRHTNDSPIWQTWRNLGATPVQADLDNRTSLKRIRDLATHLIYLAPPSSAAFTDQRLNRFLATLHSGRSLPRCTTLISTTGVYGNAHGEKINEHWPLNPQTDRGQRRVSAERLLRHWVRTRVMTLSKHHPSSPARTMINAGSILRAPGIYAAERLPIARLVAEIPALQKSDDIWTNHIHADDLARSSWLALTRGSSLRAINVSDHSDIKMGDWFDAVATACHLPKPERLPRAELQSCVSPLQYSFMSESRRLDNQRLCTELRVQLRYPTVHDFLATLKTRPC